MERVKNGYSDNVLIGIYMISMKAEFQSHSANNGLDNVPCVSPITCVSL